MEGYTQRMYNAKYRTNDKSASLILGIFKNDEKSETFA